MLHDSIPPDKTQNLLWYQNAPTSDNQGRGNLLSDKSGPNHSEFARPDRKKITKNQTQNEHNQHTIYTQYTHNLHTTHTQYTHNIQTGLPRWLSGWPDGPLDIEKT